MTVAYRQIATEQDVRQLLADLDAEYPPESHYDRRLRELAEARRMEAKADFEAAHVKRPDAIQRREARALRAEVSGSVSRVEARFAEVEDYTLPDGSRADGRTTGLLLTVVGRVVANLRKQHREEMAALRREFETKLAAIEKTPAPLPMLKRWAPQRVFYKGEVVSFRGGSWQARKDTAPRPGDSDDDWACVAERGEDGREGRELCLRGPFMHDDAYSVGDVVSHLGATFVCRSENPRGLPHEDSDSWMLLSEKGAKGERGKTGKSGPKGDKGGGYDVNIASWLVDAPHFRATPMLSNGRLGASLELRSLFELFNVQTSSDP